MTQATGPTRHAELAHDHQVDRHRTGDDDHDQGPKEDNKCAIFVSYRHHEATTLPLRHIRLISLEFLQTSCIWDIFVSH